MALSEIGRGAMTGDGVDRPVHVVASPFKTGTSSIAQALIMLGVAQAPMPYDGGLLARLRPDLATLHGLVNVARSFDHFKSQHGTCARAVMADVLAASLHYDVFHDAPMGHGHIHPFIIKAVLPRARFIWVKRPKEDWLQSVKNWELAHPKTYPNADGWHVDEASMRAKRMQRRRRARRWFAAVKRAFPDDAVVLEWSDLTSFETLAAFYGVRPPASVFPHENRYAAITE